MFGVALSDVTAATVRAVCALEPSVAQKGYVAPNAVSIAQAYFEPGARFKAVCVGDIPIGFVMWRPGSAPDIANLWRFMIDHRHQGKGYGKAALMLLCRDLRASGFRTLETSVSLPSGEFGLSLNL
jgi:diamine N-acetyltransferase